MGKANIDQLKRNLELLFEIRKAKILETLPGNFNSDLALAYLLAIRDIACIHVIIVFEMDKI